MLSPAPKSENAGDIFSRLKELIAMKAAGEIDQYEFEIFKAELIESSRRLQAEHR